MTRGKLIGWIVGAAAVAMAAAAVWWAFQHAQARRAWDEAQRAVEAQDAEGARLPLAHCLAWWPNAAEVRLTAARAARLGERYEEAEEHLARAEQLLGPSDAAARRERALLQVQQGDYRDHLAVLAPQGPSDPAVTDEVRVALACGYENTFYYQPAMQIVHRMLHEHPDDVRGNLVAGRLLIRLQFKEQAVEYLERAVRLLPSARAPRLALAECLLELGQLPDATAHLALLAERFPDDPGVLLARARLHVYRGQVETGRALLEALLVAAPDHAEALLALARLEYHHGDPRVAIAPLRRALECGPVGPAAWELLAFCHDALGEADAARRCREALSRAQSDLGAMTRLTIRIVQEKTDDLGARLELAERAAAVHDPDRAIRWYLCALQIDPAHRPTHRALAGLYQDRGCPHLAARHRAQGDS